MPVVGVHLPLLLRPLLLRPRRGRPFSVSRVRCCSGSSGTATEPPLCRASSPCSTSDREAVCSIRLKKVEELRGKGHEPYAYTWAKTHTANELQGLYVDLGNGEESCGGDDFVSVAGKIVARRAFGKLAFFDSERQLGDNSGLSLAFLVVALLIL